VVASGGVFQNQLLLDIVAGALPVGRRLLINHLVPPNDGGVSLGQAAIAAAVLRTRADRAPAR
jgi:hydrogenase maturation protein HypF